MPQSDNFEPPKPTDRPLCSNCGWIMWIALIEPHEEPEQQRHTFKCHRCDYEEIKIVTI